MAQIPIANGFYQSESLPVSNQRCVNLYPSIPQTDSLGDAGLVGTPGILQVASTGEVNQVNRGSIMFQGKPFFVNGTKLYRLDSEVVDTDDGPKRTFDVVEIGDVEGSARVSMARSTRQLMILVPEGNGYIYQPGATEEFQEIESVDFRANGDPKFVVYIDSSFVCSTTENKLIQSAVNDGLTWDALAFAAVESDPDALTAPIVVSNQLYGVGEITTEGFQNAGTGTFTFVRNNVFLDKGCVAPYTMVRTNQDFFMIGQGENESPAVWQFVGNRYIKISTNAVDQLLQKAPDKDIEEAFALYYAQKGAYFVIFTFGDKTLCYDIVTQRWHERESITDTGPIRWRVNSLVEAYGEVIVFDAVDGRVGVLDLLTYSEYDERINSYFTLQPFFNEKGILLPRLELTMENGVGNDEAPDPQVSLGISRDGVRFFNYRTRAIGKKGELNRRIIWRRNGRADRMTVLRFGVSAKVKKVFIRLDAE